MTDRRDRRAVDPITHYREHLASLCLVAEGQDLDATLTFIGEHLDDNDVRPMLALLAHAYVERVGEDIT